MKYRLYAFVINLYMGPVQWGIQSGHAAQKLSVKYTTDSSENSMYRVWAIEGPTIMVLQGMNLGNLKRIDADIEELAEYFGLPWANFHEDEESLGGIMTCTSILIPETLFDCTIERDENRNTVFVSPAGLVYDQNRFPAEHKLLSLIKLAKLAGS